MRITMCVTINACVVRFDVFKIRFDAIQPTSASMPICRVKGPLLMPSNMAAVLPQFAFVAVFYFVLFMAHGVCGQPQGQPDGE